MEPRPDGVDSGALQGWSQQKYIANSAIVGETPVQLQFLERRKAALVPEMPASESLFVTQCSHCGGWLNVSVEQIGRPGTCGGCMGSVVVTALRPADSVSSGKRLSFESMSGSGISSEVSYEGKPATSSVPESLGRFRFKAKIGYGGFGDVWLATDTQLQRSVAIKLPRFDSTDAKRHRRFLVESRAAAALRHPNIVPTLDAGELNGQLYIASEYVKGVPLTQINGDRPAPAQWVVNVVGQLAGAVAFAHEEGIVHRDLKPDNVLVDSHGQPQLLDFGLAKRIDDDSEQAGKTVDGTVLGTPSYMSPEQAAGQITQIGPASDQYSLGVMLYRLLAGKTPFQGTPLAVLQQVISQPTPPLLQAAPRVSADLAAICDKARAFDPSDRYASCEDFRADLQRFADGEPVQARPLSRLNRLKRWANANRHEATLAGVCGLVASVVLVVSSLGWASASVAMNRAGQAEQAVRDETQRLVSLRDQLDQQVTVAEKRRQEAAEARDRMMKSRQQFEAENARLAESTAAAELALAQVKEAMEGVESQQSSRDTFTEKLNDALKDLVNRSESEPSPSVEKKEESVNVVSRDLFSSDVLKAVAREKIPVIQRDNLRMLEPAKKVDDASLHAIFRNSPIEFKQADFVKFRRVAALPAVTARDIAIDEKSKQPVLHLGTDQSVRQVYLSNNHSGRSDFNGFKNLNGQLQVDWRQDWETRGNFAIKNSNYWVLCHKPAAVIQVARYGKSLELKAIVDSQGTAGAPDPPMDIDSLSNGNIFLIRQRTIQRLDNAFNSSLELAFGDTILDAEPITDDYWIIQLREEKNRRRVHDYFIDIPRNRYQLMPGEEKSYAIFQYAVGLNETFLRKQSGGIEVIQWTVEETP